MGNLGHKHEKDPVLNLIEYSMRAYPGSIKTVFSRELFDAMGLRVLRESIDMRPEAHWTSVGRALRSRLALGVSSTLYAIPSPQVQLGLHLLPGDGSLASGLTECRTRVQDVFLVFEPLEEPEVLDRNDRRYDLAAAAQYDTLTCAHPFERARSTLSRS
jgi:hypothetical protein